jgi:hypothetical protein
MQNVATHPGFTLQSEPLLDGDAGTQQTIRRIRGLVDDGVKDPFVNKAAGTILRAARVRPYDDLGEIQALFAYVVNPRNIRFTKDPDGKETLRPAATILQWGFGDCDDINAILLPSLLATVGVPRENMRLVTIASHPGAPRSFSHVYLEVLFRGRWIPLDAARKNTTFGTEPARQYRKRVWSLVDDSFQDLKGLGDCGCACAAPRLGSQMRLGRTYRASGLGRIGDFNWSDLSNAITPIATGAANIIRASTGQPQIVFPSTGGYPVPQGVQAPSYGGGPSASGSFSISPGLAIMGGLFVLAMLARRG